MGKSPVSVEWAPGHVSLGLKFAAEQGLGFGRSATPAVAARCKLALVIALQRPGFTVNLREVKAEDRWEHAASCMPSQAIAQTNTRQKNLKGGCSVDTLVCKDHPNHCVIHMEFWAFVQGLQEP